MGLGYLGGLVLFVLSSPITVIVALIVALIMLLLAQLPLLGPTVRASINAGLTTEIVAFIASCLVLAGVFLGVPWWFLRNAEYRVSWEERVRVWRDEFWRERPRRQRRVRKLKGEKAALGKKEE
jgi:hypothetical protein